MKKKIAFVIASLFGIGFAPIASGTVASFATLFAVWALAYFWGAPAVWAGAIISLFVGVWATGEVLKYTKHDPSFVVIDEFAGQMITFAFIAPAFQNCMNTHVWIFYGLGFFFFRLFDITKPWIVGRIDKQMTNAWGVMLDDVIAGFFAAVCLAALMIVLFGCLC